MKKHRVDHTEEAKTDIRQAYIWLAKRSPAAASRLLDRIDEGIDTLEVFPARGPLAPESEFFGEEIRELTIGKYRVLYVIDKSTVTILHVRHSSRDYLRPDPE